MDYTVGPDDTVIFTMAAEEQDMLIGALEATLSASEEGNVELSAGVGDGTRMILAKLKEATGARSLRAQMEQHKKAYEELREKLVAAGMLQEEETPAIDPYAGADPHAPLPWRGIEDPDLTDEQKREIELMAWKAQKQASNAAGGNSKLPMIRPAGPPRRPAGY